MTYSSYNPIADRVCLICGYPKFNNDCEICFLMTKETTPEILNEMFIVLWNYRTDEYGIDFTLSEIDRLTNKLFKR